ncbi:hypothetical protein BH10BDE1_BH10BDE1_29470 [soil metagenome]
MKNTLLTSVFAIAVFGLSTVSAATFDTASEQQLRNLQKNLAKGAYGADGKSKDVVSAGPVSKATQPADEDACDSFYWPTPKLRLTKTLPAIDPCADLKTAVLADTKIQVIFLCKDGKTVADYDFSMGRSGSGKTTLGDLKTPLGKYPLAKPYKSDKFKVFIPIGYPTTSQVEAGMTGADVGIHGPARPFRCAGFLNAAVNWTQGCIAVPSDIYVKEIGRFVQQNNVREISILPVPALSK